MKSPIQPAQLVASWLILALALPSPVLALRAVGLEERGADQKADLVASLTGLEERVGVVGWPRGATRLARGAALGALNRLKLGPEDLVPVYEWPSRREGLRRAISAFFGLYGYNGTMPVEQVRAQLEDGRLLAVQFSGEPVQFIRHVPAGGLEEAVVTAEAGNSIRSAPITLPRLNALLDLWTRQVRDPTKGIIIETMATIGNTSETFQHPEGRLWHEASNRHVDAERAVTVAAGTANDRAAVFNAIREKVVAAGLEEKDYYSILDVSREASQEEIHRAYRRLAKKWHPDVNPGRRTEAEERSKQLNEAHWVLSDGRRRSLYDGQRQSVDTPSGSLSPWSQFFVGAIGTLVAEMEHSLRDTYGFDVTVVRRRVAQGTRSFAVMWNAPHYASGEPSPKRRCLYGIQIFIGEEGTEAFFTLGSIAPAPSPYPSEYYTIMQSYAEQVVPATWFAHDQGLVEEELGGYKTFVDDGRFRFQEAPDQYMDLEAFQQSLRKTVDRLLSQGVEMDWLTHGWLNAPMERMCVNLNEAIASARSREVFLKEVEEFASEYRAAAREVSAAPQLPELIEALFRTRDSGEFSEAFQRAMTDIIQALNGVLKPQGYLLSITTDEDGKRRLVVQELSPDPRIRLPWVKPSVVSRTLASDTRAVHLDNVTAGLEEDAIGAVVQAAARGGNAVIIGESVPTDVREAAQALRDRGLKNRVYLAPLFSGEKRDLAEWLRQSGGVVRFYTTRDGGEDQARIKALRSQRFAVVENVLRGHDWQSVIENLLRDLDVQNNIFARYRGAFFKALIAAAGLEQSA